MKLPHIKFYRKVEHDGRVLYIELGKWWEIRITREFANDFYNYQRPGGPARHDVGIVKDRFFIKLIRQGHIIPGWYGYAYRDFNTDTAAYMPIPLNLIIASWSWFKRTILMKIKYEWPRWLINHELRIYRAGQLDGYNAGRFNREMAEGGPITGRQLLEGVDPHTNPGWNRHKI